MGILSLLAYLTVVVVTTPSLRPIDAITASVKLNWWVITGISLGTGVQAFLLAFARGEACQIKHRDVAIGTSGVFSGLSSFLSFFSLIPVGCCGTWLYLLSFLPGLLGVNASAFLIAYSFQLEVIGLASMGVSVVYTYLSLRNRLRRK